MLTCNFKLIYSILITLYLAACAQSNTIKSAEASPSTKPKNEIDHQISYQLLNRITLQLKIDDQVFEIGTITEIKREGGYQTTEYRETYIIKKDQQIYAIQIDQEGKSQSRSLEELKDNFKLEPFTEPIFELNTDKEKQRIQKDLYINLAHCRKVDGYSEILQQALRERENIYFRVKSYEYLGAVPYVIKYNYKKKQIEGLFKFVQAAREHNLEVGPIYVKTNFRNDNGIAVTDNLYFFTESFGNECLNNYKKWLIDKLLYLKKQELWNSSNANFFIQNEDDYVSQKFNDNNQFRTFSKINYPLDLYLYGEVYHYDSWIERIDRQKEFYKTDLFEKLMKNVTIPIDDGE